MSTIDRCRTTFCGSIIDSWRSGTCFARSVFLAVFAKSRFHATIGQIWSPSGSRVLGVDIEGKVTAIQADSSIPTLGGTQGVKKSNIKGVYCTRRRIIRKPHAAAKSRFRVFYASSHVTHLVYAQQTTVSSPGHAPRSPSPASKRPRPRRPT